MNNFRIYFKEVTVLDIEGSKKTFAKGKSYGFKFMSDKATKSIRKQVMKNPNMVFTLTDDTTGCYNMVYGNRKPKDITVSNLITINKGKKNKKALADKLKASMPKEEGKGSSKEYIEDIVPQSEETITIDNGGDKNE